MAPRKPWYRSSTLWIFVSILLGILAGGFFPQDQFPGAYNAFRFCSKAFIQLIKSLIIPLLFSTIVVGIAQTGDLKAVGRMGGKALLYFEVVTTLALFIGLAVANLLQPGANLPLDLSAHSDVVAQKPQTGWEIALHVFPSNVVEHAAKGDILPVVIFATLFGIALTQLGPRGKPFLEFFDLLAATMFRYTDLVMKITPIGVFGAMAYSVSHMSAGHTVDGVFFKGWPAVLYLIGRYARLVGGLYLALILFVLLVFVPVMLLAGIKIRGFLKAVKVPALTAFSTASSEAALPQLLENVIRFGVPRRVASFVIPAGYSFNLDGSTLYLVLASLAIAQAAKVELSLGQQLAMLLAFMLTSKGVAGVPRATLVIIAGTIGSFGLPAEAGIAMLLAVDSIMDMARTTVNVLGNGLASAVIARWEGVFGELAPEEAEAVHAAPEASDDSGPGALSAG